jgi:beta-galactosidase
MGSRIYLNDGWRFSEKFEDYMLVEDNYDRSLPEVRIPHTVKELPYHYCDENDYQMVSGYKKVLNAPKDWEGKAVILTFEGVAHDAVVFVNGVQIAEHHCGYTAFSADVSKVPKYGEDNLITVRVDSRETLNQPPLGYAVDYMTYGGIYRDVYF